MQIRIEDDCYVRVVVRNKSNDALSESDVKEIRNLLNFNFNYNVGGSDNPPSPSTEQTKLYLWGNFGELYESKPQDDMSRQLV